MIETSTKLTKQLNRVQELGEIIEDVMIGDTRHIKIGVQSKEGQVIFAIDQQDSEEMAVAMCWPDSSGVGYEYGYSSKIGKTLRTVSGFINSKV